MHQESRILLVGRHGQVSWELQRTLAPLGEVVALDYPEIDLTDSQGLRRIVQDVKPTLIVNAAAYTAVDKAETDLERCRAINAIGPGVLAEEAAKLGARMVHYSTDYVYPGDGTEPWTEGSPTGPLNAYGLTKLEGDLAIAAALPSDHLIFRVSWVYGARGGNFLLTMLRLFRERETLSVIDDQIGAPTSSRMIAEATALSVSRWSGQCGVYHMPQAGFTSWHGFAKAIAELDPRKPEQVLKELKAIGTDAYPTPAARPRNSRMSGERLKRDFGLALPRWEDSLRQVIETLG
jgi:dTDP-4-dehydrorhamnose reductase